VRAEAGLLGHATGLYDDLTPQENVRFWARAAGHGDAVDDALDGAGVDARVRGVAVGRLSAGQRRRASLAAFLVRRPRLWLLDEPHAGLDAEGRDVVDALVTEAVGAGATAIVASHELDRATLLAHRVVTVAGGQASTREPARVA
jgi:ABC-type transport system involved in cytochrome c biogenesis ATPase subunit